MKIGVKIFPDNREYLKQLVSKAELDFVEVMAIENEDFDFLETIGLPVVIHCEHFEFGVNLADSKREKNNISAIEFAKGLAERFDSKFIVVHPGVNHNSGCSLENVIDALKTGPFSDKRIIVENMPFRYSSHETIRHIGSAFEDIKKIVSFTGKRTCLDFGHASTVAFNKGTDHVEMARKFMELKPAYFHMSDNKGPIDIHTNLGNGVLDIPALKKMVGDNMVAIETVINLEKHINDIKLMREPA
jgi:endonuclease IV